MRNILFILVVAAILIGGVMYSQNNEAAPTTEDQPLSTNYSTNNMKATIATNYGFITLELFNELAPKTVENFAKLANDGFYSGTKFHRVIDGFMIQGGDPLSKDDSAPHLWGTGGPGYQFEDEIHAENRNEPGTISMANAGPNTNGSQFFINVANNDFLNTKHTVFGRVTQGMDVVEVISKVQVGASDRPVQPVIVESITIE